MKDEFHSRTIIPAFFSLVGKAFKLRKEFKSGIFMKSFNIMEWDTFGNYNIFGTLNRYIFSPSWLLLWICPLNLLVKLIIGILILLSFNYYKRPFARRSLYTNIRPEFLLRFFFHI